MFICSFCGNEHDEERECCPETGEKLEVRKCFNESCAKLIDAHFYECPHCGSFQLDAYLVKHSAELYSKAINFSENQYRGVHAADWRDTPKSLYSDAARCGNTENMYKACREMMQLNRGGDAKICLSTFIECNPQKAKDKWVIMARELLEE